MEGDEQNADRAYFNLAFASPIPACPPSYEHNEQLYVVCELLGGGKAKELAVQAHDRSQMKLLPWVGVAARMDHKLVTLFDVWARGLRVKSVQQVNGSAFCFLPLPVKTGLPVHVRCGCMNLRDMRVLKCAQVNGSFELSANRSCTNLWTHIKKLSPR